MQKRSALVLLRASQGRVSHIVSGQRMSQRRQQEADAMTSVHSHASGGVDRQGVETRGERVSLLS